MSGSLEPMSVEEREAQEKLVSEAAKATDVCSEDELETYARMPTLWEFLQQRNRFPKSEYVRHRDFESLYVRRVPTNFDGIAKLTVVIANVTAHVPGRGAFTRLVNELKEWLHQYLDESAFDCTALEIECVQNPRLWQWCLENGFIRKSGTGGPDGAPTYEWIANDYD